MWTLLPQPLRFPSIPSFYHQWRQSWGTAPSYASLWFGREVAPAWCTCGAQNRKRTSCYIRLFEIFLNQNQWSCSVFRKLCMPWKRFTSLWRGSCMVPTTLYDIISFENRMVTRSKNRKSMRHPYYRYHTSSTLDVQSCEVKPYPHPPVCAASLSTHNIIYLIGSVEVCLRESSRCGRGRQLKWRLHQKPPTDLPPTPWYPMVLASTMSMNGHTTAVLFSAILPNSGSNLESNLS